MTPAPHHAQAWWACLPKSIGPRGRRTDRSTSPGPAYPRFQRNAPGDLGTGLGWPHFGLTAALNVADCCVSTNSISPGQRSYALVEEMPETLTTDQKVGGSSPSERARSKAFLPARRRLLLTNLLTGAVSQPGSHRRSSPPPQPAAPWSRGHEPSPSACDRSGCLDSHSQAPGQPGRGEARSPGGRRAGSACSRKRRGPVHRGLRSTNRRGAVAPAVPQRRAVRSGRAGGGGTRVRGGVRDHEMAGPQM
jgi:hypothetical protein